MTFDPILLNTYRTLLETTDLQRAYQEFVRMFRFLRSELERQLPDFRFQSSISENAMEYAYFSFTHPALREKGLKLSVVFVHQAFQLEVWLSGVNRSTQCRWAEQLKICPPPIIVSAEAAHSDYLVRLPVQADLSDGPSTAAAVKTAAETLLELLSLQIEPNGAD